MQMLDQPLIWPVGEADVVNLDLAAHVFERDGVRFVRRFGRLFQQLEDPRGARERVLQFGHDAGNLVERLRVLVRVAQKHRKLTDRDRARAARRRDQRARDRYARVHQTVDKARGRIRDRREEDRAERVFLQPGVDFVKPALRAFFLSERLHDVLPRNHFVDQRVLLSARFGAQPEHFIGTLCDKRRNQQRYRRDQKDDQRDRRIHGKHESERAEDRQYAREKLRKADQQSVRELFDVGRHAARNLARRMPIEIGKRQRSDLAERIVP